MGLKSGRTIHRPLSGRIVNPVRATPWLSFCERNLGSGLVAALKDSGLLSKSASSIYFFLSGPRLDRWRRRKRYGPNSFANGVVRVKGNCLILVSQPQRLVYAFPGMPRMRLQIGPEIQIVSQRGCPFWL